MINFEMDYSKEIRFVPPNPELADELNGIGKCLLRTKKSIATRMMPLLCVALQ